MTLHAFTLFLTLVWCGIAPGAPGAGFHLSTQTLELDGFCDSDDWTTPPLPNTAPWVFTLQRT